MATKRVLKCKNCKDLRKYKCPDCGAMVCGNCAHTLKGTWDFVNPSCHTVLGRRGWRELGVYDG